MPEKKVVDITSFEYYANKKPYRKILEEEIDLEIYSYMQGSPIWGNHYVAYEISYDMQKFVSNMAHIRERLLKTKMAKNVESQTQKIMRIPDTIEEFKNAYAINRIISDLVIDGCIVNSDSSKCFHWDISNRMSLDGDFNKYCAEKMNRPMAKIFEACGWERESWRFFFDYPNEEEYEVLERLSNRFSELGRVNQVLGESFLEVHLVPEEYESINFEARGSYMPRNNLCEGKLNIDKVNEVIEYDNERFYNFFYKGGCRNLFK